MAALDEHPDMKCVLGLHETIVTGAADGYARMTGKPAATLLHLGPGLGNGLANLHNARRARTPLVNVVGDHATYHKHFDAPLTSDVEGIAGPVSDWVRTSKTSYRVAGDAAEAIAAARQAPGHIATLVLPADCAWSEASGPAAPVEPPKSPAARVRGGVGRRRLVAERAQGRAAAWRSGPDGREPDAGGQDFGSDRLRALCADQ